VSVTSNDIITRLRQDILRLQGYKAPETGAPLLSIGTLADAFPNRTFPTGKLHEFIAPSLQKAAASGGFVAALAGSLMTGGGDCIWISRNRKIFPPGLTAFGIQPHRLVFCDIRREKHLLWAAEEALQCKGIAAVVAEVPDIAYMHSLRLQLAIEESRVTGFLLRYTSRITQPIASTARWRVSPIRSRSPIPDLTRVGYTRWRVELEKVKNGRPGIWDLEWSDGKFQSAGQKANEVVHIATQGKTG
jgi:protein ImuA